MKLLDSYLSVTHSAGAASDGESYPEHLMPLIEKLIALKQKDENSEKSQTTSSKNRVIQDAILGTHVPMGIDSHAFSSMAVHPRSVAKISIRKEI